MSKSYEDFCSKVLKIWKFGNLEICVEDLEIYFENVVSSSGARILELAQILRLI